MSIDRDDFWDIDKLIPKRKNSISTFSTKEKTVEHNISSLDESKDVESTKLTLSGADESISNETVYTFSEGLLRSVKIKRFVDKYDFYGNFRKAALVYYDFKTAKCDFVPFYSYMPQYSQFNSQQKNFYFYWRDCVRRKKYIKTDYSYFYLYIYEILNLPDKISASDGLDLLIELWIEYRRDLPNIDSYMSLWVQDYCLIYNLHCPKDEIRDFIFDVVGASEFKEFYLSDVYAMGDSGYEAMIAYLSDYDWRSGKYAGGENREVYSKHLIRAMGMLIDALWCGGVIGKEENVAHLKRSAFRNSLCTHTVKCSLDIEYIPLSKSDTIRQSVTAALKYTENKLRALLGVKSRLAVKGLPDEYKAVIDGYFINIFEKANRERIKASMPEYEKLYDAESEGLSFEGALEIEQASWTTTARLVISDEYEPSSGEACVVCAESEIIDAESQSTENYGLSPLEVAFISAIMSDDAEEIKRVSEALELPSDSIIEKINEAFVDHFGDIIIEGEAPRFNIIDDYKDDIEEWLLKIMK